ncbi:MAG: chromate transporter [Elusimicrobiota bacterium]|jgi:chromate transporter|nr:chromate transporter [Elusimicrobiota bacterium]
MPQEKIKLRKLFFTFAKIGVMTFGGGYAMLPMMERELIEARRWTTAESLMDFYAVAQATPGVIAVNVATLIGWQKRGFKGALAATAGLVLPSFIIIIIIAAFLDVVTGSPVVARVFAALRICVAALVINALIPFFKRGIINRFTLLLFAIAFCAFMFFDFSPAATVFLCGAAYIAYAAARGRL